MMISLLVLCFITAVTSDCPIENSVNGSCCGINRSKFKFSSFAHKSHVYNITNFCGKCEDVGDGYCDATSAGGDGGDTEKG